MPDFPKDFLWGAATSSHQVESGNSNNDWWDWEIKGKFKEPSGAACNHYELFDEDFKLAKSLNHNGHRFSIEWSRIQPKEDTWDKKEIEHYKKVVASLKEKDIEPIVTLHHFTNPKWFMDKGGWLRGDSADIFAEYAKRVVEALASDVKYWITINEPLVYINGSYYEGIWPPGDKSLRCAAIVFKNMLAAHQKAYDEIHKATRESLVSIAHAMRIFTPCEFGNRTLNKLSASLRKLIFNDLFLKILIDGGYLDFIGLNYYSREYVRFGWPLGHNCHDKHHRIEWTNFMGWEVYPEGIFELLTELKKYNLPILITENGTCQIEDSEYWRFIREHLKQVKLAIEAGVPVIGYLYWSLLDNFEWDKGFGPRFGLIHVDYKTFERRIKDSARHFAEVCRTNNLPAGYVPGTKPL